MYLVGTARDDEHVVKVRLGNGGEILTDRLGESANIRAGRCADLAAVAQQLHYPCVRPRKAQL